MPSRKQANIRQIDLTPSQGQGSNGRRDVRRTDSENNTKLLMCLYLILQACIKSVFLFSCSRFLLSTLESTASIVILQ